MVGFGKIGENFHKLAPHLKDDRVVIGFVFFLFVVLTSLGKANIWIIVLTFIIILSFLFKHISKHIGASSAGRTIRNDEEIVALANKLKDVALYVGATMPEASEHLIHEAQRLLYLAGRPDLITQLQIEFDNRTPPLDFGPPNN